MAMGKCWVLGIDINKALISGNLPAKYGQKYMVQFTYFHDLGSWRSPKLNWWNRATSDSLQEFDAPILLLRTDFSEEIMELVTWAVTSTSHEVRSPGGHLKNGWRPINGMKFWCLVVSTCFNMFQHVSTCFKRNVKQTSQTVQFSTQVTGNHHLNKHLHHPWNSILRPRPRYQVSAEIIEFSWSATDENDVNHQRDDLTKFAGLKGKQCDDRSMRTEDLHSCHSSCR